MIVLNHGASFGGGRGRRARPRADPPGDDGRRGPAPRARVRSRIVNSDSQGMGRIDGDGPPDDPARARHDGLARDRRPAPDHPGLPAEPDDPFDSNRPRPPLPRQGHDRAGDHARPRRPRRVAGGRAARRHRPVEARPSSASSRSSSSRAGTRRGARSARATRRSSGPSRPATGPTGAAPAEPPRACRRRSCRRGARRTAELAEPPRARGRTVVAVTGTRGLTRANARLQPGDGADRDRPGRRPRDAGGPAARRRAGHGPAAEPPLLPALTMGREACVLISASCTTSWFDWIHGELWLCPDGLLRRSVGLTRHLSTRRREGHQGDGRMRPRDRHGRSRRPRSKGCCAPSSEPMGPLDGRHVGHAQARRSSTTRFTS